MKKIAMRVAFSSFAFLWVIPFVSSTAEADGLNCEQNSNGGVHWNYVAHDATERYDILGVHTNALVNDFNSGLPCVSVRSVFVWEDGNNKVEFGWVKKTGFDYNVFYTWTEDGIYRKCPSVASNCYMDPDIHPNGGSTHDFKIQNANGNHSWAFDYDGQYIGDSVTVNFSIANNALVQTEIHNWTDSAYAHFHGITDCWVGGCPYYTTFGRLQESALTNDQTHWKFCKVNDGEAFYKEVGPPC